MQELTRGGDRPGLTIGSVVVNARYMDSMTDFWSRALGYEPRARDRAFRVLDGGGSEVSLSLQHDHKSLGQNLLHLDLYADDVGAEVSRLERLGARVVRDPKPGDDFVVLADPEGNLFCVVQR